MGTRFDLGGVGSHAGWTTVNLDAPADVAHDITDLDALAPEDGSVEAFRLSHTLEHVPITAYPRFLRHLYTKLKPGGWVEVVQTDAGAVIDQWVRGELSFRSMRSTLFPPADRVGANPLNLHQNMWTADELARDLRAVGFDVQPFDAGSWGLDTQDAFCPDDLLADRGKPVRNLGLRATKPDRPRRIPNELHFVFGMRPDFGGRPFSLVHYLAIRSAVEVNRPDRVRLWYAHEPTGEWWERAKLLVELCPISEVADYDGIPLDHYAHRADVVRLRVLIAHGGIYLDLDTVCVRPFADLLHHPAVVGFEAAATLCNAVLLAEPGSEFLRRCLAAHRLFRPGMWAEICNGEMTRVASAAPHLVHTLGQRAFHWPDCGPDGYRQLHRDRDAHFPEAYCHHLWEHDSWNRGLKDLSVAALRDGENAYVRLVRRFLPGAAEVASAGSRPPGTALVVAVCTCRANAHRQAACRETWFGAVRAIPGVAAVFFDGGPDDRDDTLGLDCPDDWGALPTKVARLVRRVATEYPGAWLFKCDDDTFVVPGRLTAFVNGCRGHYTGAVLEGEGGQYASGGAGYLLSPAAVRALAGALTGGSYEDVEVGRALARFGVRPAHSERFRAFREDRPPADRVTEHYVDPDGMRARWSSFAAVSAVPLSPRPDAELPPLADAPVSRFRVVRAATGYGGLGVGGDRGHSVDGSDRVAPPADGTEWPRHEFLAAHAPSTVEIELETPHAVVGFLDGPSWPTPDRPTRFLIDGRLAAALDAPHRRTPERLLPAGRYTLETECPTPITRRYPVWALRPVEPGELRVVMPTSNRYVGVARTSLRLLRRFWPEHPPVEVVRHDEPVDLPPDARARQFGAGPQDSVAWTQALAWYLREHSRSEFVLLVLDDYGLFAPPRADRIEAACRVLTEDYSVASVGLTAMAVPTQVPYGREGGHELVVVPPWEYAVHTQATVWRRASLLRLLHAVGPATAAAFELAASHHHNTRQRAFEQHLLFACHPETPLFLDADPRKGEWALPYHNLMHAGRPDPRHAEFVASADA